jgi:alanine racemase
LADRTSPNWTAVKSPCTRPTPSPPWKCPSPAWTWCAPAALLFGDTVPSFTEYKRVMQFKSHVASVNSYPKGNTVGYDRTYTLKRDSKLANITVGYSDGYRRAFTNKGIVLINGHRVPVVGKVSMNTLMVDVTDVPTVKSGDEVVLFGKQGNVRDHPGGSRGYQWCVVG